jgi:hypothetical protein
MVYEVANRRITFGKLLQRALAGMARLKALLRLLGSAAMVVLLGGHGCHIAATAGFESKGNGSQRDREDNKAIVTVLRAKCAVQSFVWWGYR